MYLMFGQIDCVRPLFDAFSAGIFMMIIFFDFSSHKYVAQNTENANKAIAACITVQMYNTNLLLDLYPFSLSHDCTCPAYQPNAPFSSSWVIDSFSFLSHVRGSAARVFSPPPPHLVVAHAVRPGKIDRSNGSAKKQDVRAYLVGLYIHELLQHE